MQIEPPMQGQMHHFEGCTYYGFREDRQIKALYPTHQCVCYAGEKPERIDIAHQAAHCLSPHYQACAVFMRTGNSGQEQDAVMAQPSNDRQNRMLPMLAWTVLLVWVLALGSWVFLQIRAATVAPVEEAPTFTMPEEAQPKAVEKSSEEAEEEQIFTQGEAVNGALPTPMLTVFPTAPPTAVPVEATTHNLREQAGLPPEKPVPDHEIVYGD